MENVNEQRRKFISPSELEFGPLEFKFKKVTRTFDNVNKWNNRVKD